MATMIPATYLPGTSSNAEKKVFNFLQKDINTAGWTVFHSLNLSINAGRRYGEIDFVLLIPNVGIICLEVKGGGIRCQNGQWSTIDADGNTHTLKRSPFAQITANMFTLRERLLAHFGTSQAITKIPTGFIAVFPDCMCPAESPEFIRAEAIDCNDLKSPISNSILKYAAVKLGYPGTDNKLCTPATIKELRAFLRPDFDRAIARSATIGSSEARIIEFSQEQLQRLEELADNERCLFEGPAGTGKTLLALNLAKAKAAEGQRVLLICFNRLLGKWLAREAEDTPRLRAGSFYSILRKLVILSDFEKEFVQKESAIQDRDTEFYSMLSEYARLAILQFNEKFDMLIVDEIQDLATIPTLSVFNDLLTGGLAKGSWAFFGDFYRQSIFQSREASIDAIKKFASSYTKSNLLNNCRNTKQIAEAATTLSGFSTFPYRASIANGLPVQYHYWKDKEEQLEQITETIESYKSDGVSINDIQILSPYRLENSALSATQSVSGFQTYDVSDTVLEEKKRLKFCTVHAFKGMESSIVLITDLDANSIKENQSLIYVGMTRARSGLHVYANKNARSSIQHLLSQVSIAID